MGFFGVDDTFLTSCHFYTNTDIAMRSFVMLSSNRLIVFDMRYMMIQSMVAKILSFWSKGHDNLSMQLPRIHTIFRVLPLRNDNGIIDTFPRLLYDASF